jgi:cytochrome P450
MNATQRHFDGEPIDLPTTADGPFDPPPEFAQLREHRPLCPLRYPDRHVGWLVTGHALARTILNDPRFSMHPPRLPIGGAVVEALQNGPESAGDMLLMDPPEHTRLRRLQTSYFTVGRVSELRPAIEQIVAERLDAMEKAGPPLDLVAMFTRQVPSMTICEVLGVPYRDAERFERPTALLMSDAPDKAEAMDDFYEYVHGVIRRKRVDPGGDLLSELIAAGELPDNEMAGLAFFLFAAGHDTTASMLALSSFFLLHDREHWQKLRTRPDLLPDAVEELLRYLNISPAGTMSRTALEDIELNGRVIRAGDAVTVHTGAANRDPAAFSEPDRFDPERSDAGHVAFAYGRHTCLGQHLARLELRVALGGLISRFPSLRLAVPPEDVPLQRSEVRCGVGRLPVTW